MSSESVQNRLTEAKANLKRRKETFAIAVSATAFNGVALYVEHVLDSPMFYLSLAAGAMTATGAMLSGSEIITTGQSVAALEGALAQHQLTQESYETVSRQPTPIAE